MMTRTALVALGFVGLMTLAGCEDRDPYLRTDVWKPAGVNSTNLAAMVADPHDLIRGRSTKREDAKAPALAVDHIWADQPKNLPSGGGSSGSSGGSGG